ncbi:MAG: polysaccharide biosynthesis C-terminal domain-containing protein [Chloroflexi bacterium]|nr:polysaccharide biosynthesis C-terminal domain-containing protein [Chloroflexota bacterium]
MSRHFRTNHQDLKRVAQELVGLLLAVALPAAIAVFCAAEWVLWILYGGRVQAAATPLRILVWCIVLRAVTAALGQLLMASQRERVTLRIVSIDALTSFTVGLILIPHFGVVGAAVTALTTRCVDLVQHVIPVTRLLSGFALSRLGWTALAASMCMAVWVAVVPNQIPILTLLTGGLVYASVLLGLMIWASGGLRQLRTTSMRLWTE